jgi:hypothetical protein
MPVGKGKTENDSLKTFDSDSKTIRNQKDFDVVNYFGTKKEALLQINNADKFCLFYGKYQSYILTNIYYF